MFVIHRKGSEQFLSTTTSGRVELADLQNCRTFLSEKGANVSLRCYKTKYWLEHLGYQPNQFQILPILVQIQDAHSNQS